MATMIPGDGKACIKGTRVMVSVIYPDVPAPEIPWPDRLRLRKENRSVVRRIVNRVINHLDKEPLTGRLWIVDEHRIRIHLVSETI